MYARNVTAPQLQEIARLCGFEAECDTDGNRVRFNLINKSDEYWVISRNIWGSDRTYRSKVCYHGHWEFFERLFEEYPDAIVDTSYYGRYRYTAQDWKESAAELGSTVIRLFDGLTPRDKCDCGY